MDFVKIMWISGFLENSVLNGCLLVFFLINLFHFWVCVLRSRFVFLLFLFKTYLDLNLCDFLFLILFLIFFI